MRFDPESFLLELFKVGVAAANPKRCMDSYWPDAPAGRVALIACGKAAIPMVEASVGKYGTGCRGIAVVPDGYADQKTLSSGVEVLSASHPVPDSRSMHAAERALQLASELTPADLLLFLASGGGSSLMCLPAAGVTLDAKKEITRQLLSCGASISETNCVRKHLSRVKGGRLAAVTVAPIVTLAISDVPGNELAMIASGPTVPDRTSLAEARAVIEKYGLTPALEVNEALLDPANESPQDSLVNPLNRLAVVASGQVALEAAAERCRERQIEPLMLGDHLEGDATGLARKHAREALSLASEGRNCCLLSGGETTVTLCDNPGRGGRNTEYALALALELDGDRRIWALAGDTDGIDGIGGHTGAIVGPDVLTRARAAGLDPALHMKQNDSAGLFQETGGLFSAGATHTNVNDFRAILVMPRKSVLRAKSESTEDEPALIQ